MAFECKRCNFSCEKRGNLRDHYKRKFICKPLKSDADVSKLLKELYPVTDHNLVCSKCNTVFIKLGMLENHVCSKTETRAKEKELPTEHANHGKSDDVLKQIFEMIAELRAENKELKDILMQFITHGTPIQPQVPFVEAPVINVIEPVLVAPKVESKSCPSAKDNTNQKARKPSKKVGHTDAKIKPIYSPDISSENVDDLIHKMKAVRSVKDITELVVSRCEEVYFKNPVNRSLFKFTSNGGASLFDTHKRKWGDSTFTNISKEMSNFATEDFINKLQDFHVNLSIESETAWDSIREIYDKPSHFLSSTTEKIVNTLFYPEMNIST